MCDALKNLYTCHMTEKGCQFQCKLCLIKISSVHVRRRLYHFLPTKSDGSIRACKSVGDVSRTTVKQLELYLDDLNATKNKRATKRKRMKDAADSIVCPKVQSRLKLSSSKFAKPEIDLAFARMVTMSICRSGFLDSYFTKHFFETYMSYAIPSRRTLYRTLLDQLYEDTRKKVLYAMNLRDADTLLTLSMDSWNAPNGEHIRNYMGVADNGIDNMLFARQLGSTSQTGEAIAKDCLSVMKKYGVDNFCSVVTDNAANETSSWKPITKENPDILCTGCACHGATLMFKDICDHTWAKRIVDDATKLMKFIKHHTWTNKTLKKMTAAKGKQRSILLHAETRFAGSYYSMFRLIEVKSEIKSMVVTDEFESKKYANQAEIQRLCQKKSFWDDVTSLVKFMRPLKNLIRLMDHSHHTTHLVYPALVQLGDKWLAMKGNVTASFYNHAMSKYRYRVKYILFPVHHITYALSPEHHADNIWALDKVMSGTTQIMRVYLDARETSEAESQLIAYKAYRSPTLFPYDPKSDDDDDDDDDTDPNADKPHYIKSPKNWWRINGSKWPLLQTVALRVFSVGTASAPSERNFSAFGNIWNLRSYNISDVNAIKLVYVYYNTRKLFKQELDAYEGIEYGWLDCLDKDEPEYDCNDSSDDDSPPDIGSDDDRSSDDDCSSDSN